MASYKKYEGSPEERDAQAIEDIINWCSEEQWNTLLMIADAVREGQSTISAMNLALAFVGISGYPFHAFCRKYCLKPYRQWMAAGPDSIQTDERGYGIYDKEETPEDRCERFVP